MKYFIYLLLVVFILSCGKEKEIVQKPVADEVIEGFKITGAEKQKLYNCAKEEIPLDFGNLEGELTAPDINDKEKFQISLFNYKDTLRATVIMYPDGEAKNSSGVVQKNLSLTVNFYKINNDWYEVRSNGAVNKI